MKIHSFGLAIAITGLLAGMPMSAAIAQNAAQEFSAAPAQKKQSTTRAAPKRVAPSRNVRTQAVKPARTHAAKPARSATPKATVRSSPKAKSATPASRTTTRHVDRPATRATIRHVDRPITRDASRAVVRTKPITRGPGAVKRHITRGPSLNRRVAAPPPRYWNGWRRPARVVVIRDRWRFWGGYGWRTYVPFTALATLAVGAAVFYPVGYVSMPEPVCAGVTPDGNRLRWMEVPTEEGGSEWQCVAYSPEPNRVVSELALPDEPPIASPPSAVGTVPAPVATGAASASAEQGGRRGCELVIYSDANLRGTSAPTDEDQADLGPDGWKDEIASVEVKSGTWDFFTGDNYTGEMMRLGPGSYTTLDARWARHIGSFMCSKPSAA